MVRYKELMDKMKSDSKVVRIESAREVMILLEKDGIQPLSHDVDETPIFLEDLHFMAVDILVNEGVL